MAMSFIPGTEVPGFYPEARCASLVFGFHSGSRWSEGSRAFVGHPHTSQKEAVWATLPESNSSCSVYGEAVAGIRANLPTTAFASMFPQNAACYDGGPRLFRSAQCHVC